MPRSASTKAHKAKADQRGPVHIAVITVSDTRTPATDANARYLFAQIKKNGHKLASYHLVLDDPKQIRKTITEVTAGPAQVVLFNGGTGISKRDTTYDVLEKLLDKVLPGFGEVFRMLSFKEIGAAAMLSRAIAGIYKGKVVFSTPGSPHAVKLAWQKLILPELKHVAWELNR